MLILEGSRARVTLHSWLDYILGWRTQQTRSDVKLELVLADSDVVAGGEA
jgi:hypothetical protein